MGVFFRKFLQTRRLESLPISFLEQRTEKRKNLSSCLNGEMPRWCLGMSKKLTTEDTKNLRADCAAPVVTQS
jgi:hypothetical protein